MIKILTKRNANKIAQQLTKQFTLLLKNHGVKPKMALLNSLEINIFNALIQKERNNKK